MDAELMALASSAATTVVGMMATDGWESAKRAVAAVWRRRRPEEVETIEAELVETRTELLTNRQTEGELQIVWRTRLRSLLAADPELAGDLRELLAELGPLAPEAAQGSRVVRGTASDHATIYMAGGDVHVNNR
ncbi:hypothetical protein F4556_006657 [Kitasatospora gansuensis]|uniref:Uncharacterized protein n=1 Tax=Kitasatospora gansuensis TaxID=258050 RepID=A0A7W7SIS1_9ACTN|nr:hypothetical protein [Kitasatospora gansuensis]MBB4951122.1 hypothetical protein [Kitasatospora gansuensis]